MGTLVLLVSTGHTQNPQLQPSFNMIAYVVACIALASVADATFVIGTAAATTGTVYTVTSASAASLALLGGVAILKGVVLAAALPEAVERDLLKKTMMLSFPSWLLKSPLNATDD